MTIWMRIVLAAAIVTTLAIGYNALTRHHYQRGYDAAVAVVNAERLAQIAAAQAETDQWKQQAEEAEHAHAKLQTEINRLVTVNADLRGCAATSTVRAPAECPQLPSRPALTQPPPSVTYSESAQAELTSLQAAMQRWQQRLIGTRLTPRY